MPFLDRYWWLRHVLAAAILFVPSQPILLLYDAGILSNFIHVPLDHIGDVLYSGLFARFFLAIAFVVTTGAIPARRRKRQRIAAISGNPEAIPRALVLYPNIEYDLAQNRSSSRNSSARVAGGYSFLWRFRGYYSAWLWP